MPELTKTETIALAIVSSIFSGKADTSAVSPAAQKTSAEMLGTTAWSVFDSLVKSKTPKPSDPTVKIY